MIDIKRMKARASNKRWYMANREKRIASILAWRAANKDKVRGYSKAWKARNKDKIAALASKSTDAHRAACLRWKHKNPELHKSLNAAWRAKNKEYLRMDRARRRARERAAIHPAHDPAKERALIKECKRLEAQTGTRHTIDHIIPLAAGGWHHHDNMQVMPLWLNSKKGKSVFWDVVGYKNWKDVPIDLWPEWLRQAA